MSKAKEEYYNKLTRSDYEKLTLSENYIEELEKQLKEKDEKIRELKEDCERYYEDLYGGEKIMKIAKNEGEAWNIQDMKKDEPHGWIQWKGTDVCMDIYCKCGHHSHIDAYCAYHVKCPDCGTIYMCNGHIEFIEIIEDPENCVIIGE